MTSLTDRYVWAVVRAVPESQRSDIERELRASIADDIEARVAAGADQATAERDVLLALGDPDRLAASYAQRPNMLIGPRYYFDYLRLLKVLYAVVLPIVVVVVIAGQVIAGNSFGEVMGTLWPIAIALAVHLGFWTTLVFAILERTVEGRRGMLTTFRLESLPELPDPKAGTGIGEFIAAVVFLVFFGGAIVWQQMASWFKDASGNPIPVLQPDLWEFWLPYFLALIAAEIVFAALLFARRRWTWPLALINVVLNVAFTVPALTLLWREQLINPAFLVEINLTGAMPQILLPILTLVFVGAAVGDSVDGMVKAYRAAKAVKA